MLQFVLGRAGSGKTEYLRKKLTELCRAGAGRLMMIVPEQYSFGTEKAILELAGPKDAARIDVVSFTRLADMVFRQEGGVSGRRLSEGGRRMMMNLAVHECADHLDLYAPTARDGKITDIMLTAVSEMKLCGITEEQLRQTAAELPEGALRGKLRELSLIYGTYNALVEQSYLDSRDDLTRLAQKLEGSSFFEGVTVAVDSFEGFTVQEMRILSLIMAKAAHLMVALCTDDVPEKGTGLFALVNRTKRTLKFHARENGVKLAPDVLLTGQPRFLSPALRDLESGLFCAEEAVSSDEREGLVLCAARDLYEEAEFVAATIRRLVMEEGYQYRDVTIICRNPDRYALALDAELKKREIPCFVSVPESVDAEPVMRLVLSAFEIGIRGFQTEAILEILKTGLTGFTPEEISELENYAFVWRLKAAAWRQPFRGHPEGFGHEMDEEAQALLIRLNALRERVTGPLMRFRAATRDATGFAISNAVYELLCDFHIDETLPAYCEKLEEMGEPVLARKQVRVWELLISLLEQMAAILGGRPTARERYYLLLKDVIRAEDLSEIPSTADQVLFGSPEQVRQSSPKVVLLMGATQGEFPPAPRSSGVFSDAERKKLIELELPFGDPLEQKTIEERYLAYSAACLPRRTLFVSWPRSLDGDTAEPSEIVNGIRGIFPGLPVWTNLPAEYFANAKEAAFSKMAALYRENTPEAAALSKLFAEDAAYRGRLDALKRAAEGQRERLEAGNAADLFGTRPYLSATQIERFYSCHFRYFCQYGLRARERRAAAVDAMQYGTIMHFLLEKFFRKNEAGELTPVVMEEGKLEELIETYIREYVDRNMGGYDNMSPRDRYRFGRMRQSAAILIRHIYEELEQSVFRPVYFEMQLGPEGDLPPLAVESPDGNTAYVVGAVDRVDAYDGEEGRYVRVIDYKTGKKDFRLQDVLYGLNMQMLVYLAALAKNGKSLPAGVLYTPLASPSVSADRDMDREEIKGKAEKQLRMNGVVLNRTAVIRAMESAGEGRYIPAALKKDGSVKAGNSVMSEGELEAVLGYSKRLIGAMTDELLQGEIEAKPNMKNTNSCAYCPFGAVCGREYGDSDVEEELLGKQEIIEKMREGEV